ncbi:MAG: glutathione peroxidase [Phycisphaerae bacterium]|nr:glutathione peroxidase [Phycisphaerae bacterium]
MKGQCIYDFRVKDIDGKEVSLADYKGKVLLIVNTASKCGYTPQYAGLEQMYEKHRDRGFLVLGFPANEFGRQEPGDNPEIKAFCEKHYGVKFPMFSKVCVKGDGICDLYKYLTSKETNPTFGGDIRWNFTKFLVDREGKIIARFEPNEAPDRSEKMNDAVKKALAATPSPSASPEPGKKS